MNNPISTTSVLQLLDRVQQLVVTRNTPDGKEILYPLFSEDWDWLVVMQTLVELDILPAPKQRPPLAAFLSFLHTNKVRTHLTHIPSKDALSRTHRRIKSATYPWSNVHWQEIQNTLPRWCKLHEALLQSWQSICDETAFIAPTSR